MIEIIEGMVSLMITRKMICILLAPKERAASINCLSTAIKLFSKSRAINAVAAMERGTMMALSPMVVPTSILVIGEMATMRISIGKDRMVFTKKLSTV